MSVKSGTVVGFRVLSKPQVFDIPQEYAGASMQVEVPAGRYPIVFKRTSYGKYISCSMPGVIVHDSFYNHIGAHGSTSVDQHKGQTQMYHWQPYAHAVAFDIIVGDVNDVELADGVEAREIHFEYSGRKGTTAGLFVGGEKVDAR